MNVGIGTGAAHFLFWEYLFGIFGIVYCTVQWVPYKLRKVTGKKKKELISSKQRSGPNGRFIFKSRPQRRKTDREENSSCI
jgi:hypothetical protein